MGEDSYERSCLPVFKNQPKICVYLSESHGLFSVISHLLTCWSHKLVERKLLPRDFKGGWSGAQIWSLDLTYLKQTYHPSTSFLFCQMIRWIMAFFLDMFHPNAWRKQLHQFFLQNKTWSPAIQRFPSHPVCPSMGFRKVLDDFLQTPGETTLIGKILSKEIEKYSLETSMAPENKPPFPRRFLLENIVFWGKLLVLGSVNNHSLAHSSEGKTFLNSFRTSISGFVFLIRYSLGST